MGLLIPPSDTKEQKGISLVNNNQSLPVLQDGGHWMGWGM
jgi:hypothetical protein